MFYFYFWFVFVGHFQFHWKPQSFSSPISVINDKRSNKEKLESTTIWWLLIGIFFLGKILLTNLLLTLFLYVSVGCVIWKINKIYLNLNVDLKNLKKCATIVYLWIALSGSCCCRHTKPSLSRSRNANPSSNSTEPCCCTGCRHKSVLWISGESLSFYWNSFWVFLDFL